MIDLYRLRNDTETVVKLIKRKDPAFDGEKLFALDEQMRILKGEVDQLRHEKNELAQLGKQGLSDDVRLFAQEKGQVLKQKEKILEEKNEEFKDLYLRCPNIPFEFVPEGTAADNEVVKLVGQKPVFDFEPRNHVELGSMNEWFDFEAAARMTGSNFALYKNDAALLVYKLMVYMLLQNRDRGFSPVMPPYLVNEQTLEGAGNFPRFKDEVYKIDDCDLYLTPTSEVNLTSYYRGHTFMADELPRRMTAWTSCFRKEAGGYGSAERGLIRIHQFEKVELYTLCKPEDADAEQQHMLLTAESILQALDLHYRVTLLATQDCSFSSAKTYDIEVWLPGQGIYKEIASVSNCTDFQSRRSDIRYRENATDKSKFVATLNGSSLALPRLMVALMETYQKADGTLDMPRLLEKVIIR